MRLEGRGGVMNEELNRELSGLKSGMGNLTTEVRNDIGNLRTEVGGIKSDLGNLRMEVGGIKSDLGNLRMEVGGIKSDLGKLTTLALNTAMAVSRQAGDIADLKRDMVTKDDFSTLMGRIDGFAGMLQDSRWDWGKQKVRLDEHEQRISALEAKRA